MHVTFPREMGVEKDKVGRLKRCVYGTRDAGQLWENCYAEKLQELGFIRGLASPCCFYHPQRRIRIVVHGDDFTALSTAAQLDWYEKELAKAFELKIKGRLGEREREREGCDKEVRVLNRVLRVDATGVHYEADPRHAELLIKSLGYEESNGVFTPGDKQKDIDYSAVLDDIRPESTTHDMNNHDTTDNNNEQPIASLKIMTYASVNTKVSFDLNISVHETTPYAEQYHKHPRQIVATSTGWKAVSQSADPWTGKSGNVMRNRKASIYPRYRHQNIERERAESLNSVLLHGPRWEQNVHVLEPNDADYLTLCNNDFDREKYFAPAPV